MALACSFEHLGRFSVRYSERFGEGPTERCGARVGLDNQVVSYQSVSTSGSVGSTRMTRWLRYSG